MGFDPMRAQTDTRPSVRLTLSGVVLRIMIALGVMAPTVLAQEIPNDPTDLLRRVSWPSDQYSPEGNPKAQPPRTGPEFQPRPTRFKMSQFGRHWYRYAEAPEDPELALFGIEPIANREPPHPDAEDSRSGVLKARKRGELGSGRRSRSGSRPGVAFGCSVLASAPPGRSSAMRAI